MGCCISFRAKDNKKSLKAAAASCNIHVQAMPMSCDIEKWQIDAKDVKILGLVGEGAYGRIERGEYQGQAVAVKTPLMPQQRNYITETIRCAEFTSPFAVELLGIINPSSDRPLLVMEFVDGGTLLQYLKRKRENRPTKFCIDTLDIAFVIAKALNAFHTHGFIHGNLRSQNVFLTQTGNIKLSLFGGNARYEKAALTISYATSESFYWAPELFDNAVITSATDMYAFGILLTELDTLELPFADQELSYDCLIHAISHGLRPRFTPECPLWYRQLANACMATNPTERPTATHAIELLARKRKENRATIAYMSHHLAWEEIFHFFTIAMGLTCSAPCWTNSVDVIVDPKETYTDVLLPSPLHCTDHSIDCSKLQILETLGHDKYGRTDRAMYLNIPVAVRTINASPRPNYLDQLRSAYNLQSPYLTKLIGIIDANQKRPKLVNEWIDGYRLSTYFSFRNAGQVMRLNPLKIAFSIAMGLQALHEAGFVHGNLHPNKVFVSAFDEVKLIDYGGSLNLDDPSFSSVYYEGEIYYWAPELWDSHKRDTPEADIYALGVILTYLDTGVAPFGPDDRCRNNLIPDIVDNDLRPALRPNCPLWYRSLTHQCLNKNPAERPKASQVAKLIAMHKNDVAFLNDGTFRPYFAPYPWLRTTSSFLVPNTKQN